jgi:hypothetical protein
MASKVESLIACGLGCYFGALSAKSRARRSVPFKNIKLNLDI